MSSFYTSKELFIFCMTDIISEIFNDDNVTYSGFGEKDTTHSSFNNGDRTVYVDLDGVLVDFNGGFKKIFRMSPEEFRTTYKTNEMPSVYSRGKDFWSNLGWIEGGKELWEYLINNFLDVKILSSSSAKSRTPDWQPVHNMVYYGKVEWLQKNIPGLNQDDIIIVPNKKEKANYAKPNNILIDDYTGNINDWIAAGGVGIFHSAPYYRNTIQQLQQFV
jgi:5'(3')-deoxyribonucleotidase